MVEFVLGTMAIRTVIAVVLFGFGVYQQATDKRPMSLRIHQYCLRESDPRDEVVFDSCEFRVLEREVNAAMDRIERRRQVK